MNEQDAFWVNGTHCEFVSASDRAFEFGDGLFETIRYYKGRFVALNFHLKRLQIGLKKLNFPDCVSRVTNDLDEVLEYLNLFNYENAIIRVTVSRGIGLRGYEPAICSDPTIVVKLSASTLYPEQQCSALNTELGDFRLAIHQELSGIKHLNRLEQIMASMERRRKKTDELLLLNTNNDPITFIAGNFFIREHNTLYTPKLESCGVKGTRRSLILSELATKANYSVFEHNLTVERILSADEVLFCNTVYGIRSISTLGSKKWSDHSASIALHQAYIEKCLLRELN